MEKTEASWATKLKQLCDMLNHFEVTFVVVPYHGEGDEGMTEDAQYFTGEEEPEDGEKASDFDPPKELDSSINDVLSDAVCTEYPGFGDNDGSTGRVILNVKNKTVKFDHSWYVTNTSDESTEFAL